MTLRVAKKYLQHEKYDYTWNRDKGDGEYTGITDRVRVDKDEGYEVLYFIEVMMNKHSLKQASDVRRIEDALQSPELSRVVMRADLVAKVEAMLGL